MIDNQAALYTLQSTVVKSVTAENTRSKLCKLAENNTVQLRWIKAHAGYTGNELADTAAKLGGELEENQLTSPLAKCTAWGLIEDKFECVWRSRWEGKSDCHQSKLSYWQHNGRLE